MPLLFAALFGIGLVCGFIQTRARVINRISPLDATIRTLVTPISVLARGVTIATQSSVTGAFSADDLLRQNTLLRKQVAANALYGETVDRLQREVDTLRRLMQLSDTYNRTKLFADIRGFYPNDNRITISAGSKQGVRPGAPVISAEGLIGTVQTVGPNEAQVLMVTSASSILGALAINHDPPSAGLVRGENSTTLTLTFAEPEAPVAVGDLVTTAGFSEKIPRGIPIGRVIQVTDSQEIGARRAMVTPIANVGSLREVVVLL